MVDCLIGVIIGALLMRAYKDVQIAVHKATCDELADRLDNSKTMSEYYKHNLRLSKRRVVSQNQEIETLRKALYAKRGESGKVMLGVFDGGKNA